VKSIKAIQTPVDLSKVAHTLEAAKTNGNVAHLIAILPTNLKVAVLAAVIAQ